MLVDKDSIYRRGAMYCFHFLELFKWLYKYLQKVTNRGLTWGLKEEALSHQKQFLMSSQISKTE